MQADYYNERDYVQIVFIEDGVPVGSKQPSPDIHLYFDADDRLVFMEIYNAREAGNITKPDQMRFGVVTKDTPQMTIDLDEPTEGQQ